MPQSTRSKEYAQYLTGTQTAQWKRYLNVQAPYHWNIKRLNLGKTLDVGCGLGRLLTILPDGSVGIDNNEWLVQQAKSRGLTAYHSDEFAQASVYEAQTFDSILLAHVAEHLGVESTASVLADYLSLLKANGRLVIITPQEAGFRKDATHVEFIDFQKSQMISSKLGMETVSHYSFPFPRFVGRWFLYNEFISISRKP